MVAMQDLEDIKRTTGHFEPSLGDPQANKGPNPMSGIALQRWQEKAGVGSFVFHDNLAKAIQHTGRIIVSYIPLIYDTERVIRILGRDGTEEFVRINAQVQDQQTGKVRQIGDITSAKFDVQVDTGPSYATQRQESADKILAMGSAWPPMFELASDLIARGIDIPNQDDLVKRLRKRLISQGVVEPNMDDPDEAKLAAQMQQSQSNPAIDALIQAQAMSEQANAAQSMADSQAKMADIPAKRAKALKDFQEAIGQAIENMAAQRKLRIDPDGIIEVLAQAAAKSLPTNGRGVDTR
jgi:hypothetical protein